MIIISKLLDKIYNSNYIRTFNYKRKISDSHKLLEEKHISDKKRPIYYIIRYDDNMSCGWTVWERVVLFGSIYATDNNMIPVVDMQTKKNIYLEDNEVGKVNAWDKYYEQPAGVSLEKALNSENYILADPSQEWFVYLRIRRMTKEYLRTKYSQFIKLNKKTIDTCEKNLSSIFKGNYSPGKRLLGICLRGTDYVLFNHPVQPSVNEVVNEAMEKFKKYNCDYFYIATEDYDIWNKLKEKLPSNKIISYNAGNIKDVDGYIGLKIRETKSAHDTAIDYLTTLYILNKCDVLIGGKCGATIVAEYRKNPPYKYLNIIDLNK